MNDMSFEVSHRSRRAALAERLAAETGIDGPMIEGLMRRFYEKILCGDGRFESYDRSVQTRT